MKFATSALLIGCAAAQLHYGQNPSDAGGSPTSAFVTVTYTGDVYTIPVFDPTTALTYGAPTTTIYRPTEVSLTTGLPPPSASLESSHDTKANTASSTFKSTSSEAASSASAAEPPAPAVQTDNAAAPRHPDVMNAAACVFAALALL